ncbi:MAG: radical SAM protein [Bacteriovoracaceae bacterium]|nr:radical SAM protein [Bacteriovoracaceae bacterium]
MKRFRRVYIEISNICNLQCTFCPEVERPKFIMGLSEFKKVLTEVAPYTDEICLHLMGEPLSHPNFEAILLECKNQNMPVQLTTNGTLMTKFHADVFFNSSIRQINFSLHSFKDNFPGKDWRPYLYDLLDFTRLALKEKPELYINFRLWNLPGITTMRDENQDFIDEIQGYFGIAVNERVDVSHRRSKNIVGRAYFHFDTRFEWPSLQSPLISEKGFCHALSQHVGIHANGEMVACCLDKEAGNKLGNVFEQSFEEILNLKATQQLHEGFQKGLLLSDLCQRCTFISRFKKTPLPLSK